MMRKTNGGSVAGRYPFTIGACRIARYSAADAARCGARSPRHIGRRGNSALCTGVPALGSALAALVAAKRAGENQFYWSLGAGFAVFLILLIVAVLPLGQSIHFVRTVISLLCSLIASALGGYAGANMRKKKRYSHIKK